MTAKVVSLRGDVIPDALVNDDLVIALTDLLEKARSGAITGAGMAIYYADGATGYFTVGSYKRIRLIGAISQLHFMANKRLWDADQE